MAATGVLPSALAHSSTRAVVASLVSLPRITSTSFINGTGFMKCMPMTFSGRRVWAPRSVIEIDDVFEAKIAPGHGPAGAKAVMRDYRTMLAEARERIAKLKAAGKTEEEGVASKPTADYDAKFGVNERAIGNFLRVVYRSLPI